MSDNADNLRRHRADAVARGLCLECRCRFPDIGRRVCEKCLADKRERRKRNLKRGRCGCGKPKYGRYRMCPRCRRKSSAKSKTLRIELITMGICIRCQRLPLIPGHVHCLGCLDTLADRAKSATVARVGSPAIRRCSLCGETGHNVMRHRRVGSTGTNDGGTAP